MCGSTFLFSLTSVSWLRRSSVLVLRNIGTEEVHDSDARVENDLLPLHASVPPISRGEQEKKASAFSQFSLQTKEASGLFGHREIRIILQWCTTPLRISYRPQQTAWLLPPEIADATALSYPYLYAPWCSLLGLGKLSLSSCPVHHPNRCTYLSDLIAAAYLRFWSVSIGPYVVTYFLKHAKDLAHHCN